MCFLFSNILLSPTEIELPKPRTTAQDLVPATAEANHHHQEILGPLPDDRHAAAPQQGGSPLATPPPPPSRPHNTHAVPYSPTSPALDHGPRSMPCPRLLLMATLLSTFLATV